MTRFEKFTAWLVWTIIAMVANGFVVLKAWIWFVVPIFKMEPISFPEALGLMVLLRFLTSPEITPKEKSEKSLSDTIGEQTVGTILKASMLLLITWLISLFM